MTRERQIAHPFDRGFNLVFENFLKEQTKSLGVPGIFVKKLQRKVTLPDGSQREMDAPYIADPDFEKLFERAIVLLEQEKMTVTQNRIVLFSDYKINVVSEEKLPILLAVASQHDKSKSVSEYTRAITDVTKLYFLDLGELNNWERLNTVRNKTRFNRVDVELGLHLANVILFPPIGCEKQRFREALYHYLKCDIPSDGLSHVLYFVFKFMADAHIDDEVEYMKINNLIDEKANSEDVEAFYSLEQSLKDSMEVLEHNNALYKEKYDSLSADYDETKSELNKISADYQFIINILKSAFRDNPSLKNELIELQDFLMD